MLVCKVLSKCLVTVNLFQTSDSDSCGINWVAPLKLVLDGKDLSHV